MSFVRVARSKIWRHRSVRDQSGEHSSGFSVPSHTGHDRLLSWLEQDPEKEPWSPTTEAPQTYGTVVSGPHRSQPTDLHARASSVDAFHDLSPVVYEALSDARSDIRLLNLGATSRNSPLNEENIPTQVFALQDAPSFHAISYTWGSSPPKFRIKISGGYFTVRTNCYEALVSARELNTTWVWIDSVCINQNDPGEKASQVSIMDKIYAAATTVVACVSDNNVPNDFGTLIEAVPSRTTVISRDAALLRPLSAFCKLRYWSRLWVVQELCLARRIEVFCGGKELTWNDICFLKNWYVSSNDWPCHFTVLVDAATKHSRSTARMPLQNAISLFSSFGCTHAKDHIYALLGIATLGDLQDTVGLDVDYTISDLSLARKVLFRAPCEDTRYLAYVLRTVNALQIGIRNAGLEALLTYWDQRPVRPHALSSHLGAKADPIPRAVLISLRLAPEARIRPDTFGRLSAAFSAAPFPAETGYGYSTYPFVYGGATANIGSDDLQYLYCNNQLSAITTGHVREGDWVLGTSLTEKHFILARHAQDATYEIIGQGITTPGFAPPIDPAVTREAGISILASSGQPDKGGRSQKFEIVLCEDDAFVMAAHYAALQADSGLMEEAGSCADMSFVALVICARSI